MPRLIAAPDKFKGTASAVDVASSIARGARAAGWEVTEVPMADGGEGILEALGGVQRRTRVHDPLGHMVEAEWRMKGATAVIEMAQASGLTLAGGSDGNDALQASTEGTGELIAAAVAAGARRVVVGVGGSATTDGGLGAVRAIETGTRLKGVELLVACDVMTKFVDAARVFAPQKGATPAEVSLLERRLERLAQMYLDSYGVDVTGMVGAGAAGGLAGGLATLGATLVPGFDLVSESVGLPDLVAEADLVVTGEGLLDPQSFEGKVVGGVIGVADATGTGVLVVVGDVDEEATDLTAALGTTLEVVSLSERFGSARSRSDPSGCIEEAVTSYLNGQAEHRR